MSNASFAGTNFDNSPTKTVKTRHLDLTDDSKTTSSSRLNQSTSPGSSLSGSQDTQQLQCSESMLSLTQSSCDSQDISEPGIQELVAMSNPRKDLGAATNKPVLAKSGDQLTSSTSKRPPGPNGQTTVVIQQGQVPEQKPLNAIAVSHASVLSSNLSQLAELAASQTPNQMTKYSAATIQPHANTIPVQAGHRFVVPGQNVPIQLEPQSQGQLPLGYGPLGASQAVPPGMIPPPFKKGSIIQLTSGELKRVEDLTTEDFVHSTSLCPDLKLETSTVVSVRKNDEVGMGLVGFNINSTKAQVTLSCPVEHPFFVYGQGWSSCIPEQSLKKYDLQCHSLKVGDICIFLSPNLAPTIMTIPGIPPGHVVPGNGIIAGSHVLNFPEQAVHASTPSGNSPGGVGSPVVVKQVQATKVQSPGLAVQVTSAQLQTGASPTPTISFTQAASPALPGGTITVIDPKAPGSLGFIRSPHVPGQTFINQHVIGSDGKPMMASGIPVQPPTYYQSVPASFVTPVTSQTFAQSAPGQSSVGNGLLQFTAVGFVPGQHPIPMSQQGLVYAAHLSEMAHKQGQEKPDGTEASTREEKEPGPSDAKRQKLDLNTDGK